MVQAEYPCLDIVKGHELYLQGQKTQHLDIISQRIYSFKERIYIEYVVLQAEATNKIYKNQINERWHTYSLNNEMIVLMSIILTK